MAYIFLILVLAFVLFVINRTYVALRVKHRLSLTSQNAELVRVLLNLEEQSLEELFELYKQQFGQGAARYAQQTYKKWKTGKVRPTKQTFNRFLINLPKVMSFDLKCEVLRKLREAYCARDNYQLTVYTDDWKQELTPLVQTVLRKANEAELPVELCRRLAWLADDDVQVAGAILANSLARQSLDALGLLDEEFSNIERLLDNAPGRGKVTHILKLPLGSITLNIKRR
jgi:hypothetical protein